MADAGSDKSPSKTTAASLYAKAIFQSSRAADPNN
jgi:hypothetical protein